jgi:plasmid segregation protein ParM
MILVSLDIGNGFVKGYARPGGAEREIIFPSVGAVEQGAIKFEGLKNGSDLVIDYNDKRVALGDSAYRLGRMQVVEMGRARIGEPAYMDLYAGALSQLVRNSSDVTVVASLPVRSYMSAKEDARRALQRQMVIGANGRTNIYNVSQAHIVPEGFGALCTLVLTGSGKIANAELGRSNVGVVDIGTRTTDYLDFNQLELVPVASDGQDKTGMATVWQLVGEMISDAYQRELSEVELDQVIHTHQFSDAGQQVNVTHFVNEALDALAATITGQVRTMWDDGRAIDCIAVSGGGAAFVFDRLPFANKLLVNDGAMANVRGAYAFGLLRGFGNES